MSEDNTLKAYKRVFSTEDGILVMNDLIEVGGVLKSSHVPNDPYGTAYNEGWRSLTLHLLNRLSINPNDVRKMHEDNIKHRTEEDYV